MVKVSLLKSLARDLPHFYARAHVEVGSATGYGIFRAY